MTIQLLLREPAISEQEWAEIVDALTRREFLAGGVTLGVLGLGLAGSGEHADAAGEKGWTYIDDLGRRVHLAKRPTRIVALVDGIVQAVWPFGIRVVGAPVYAGNSSTLALAGLSADDRAHIKNIGSSQINVEAVADTHPDLLVDLAVDGKLASLADTPQLSKVAPMIGLNMNQPLDRIEASVRRLGLALGVTASPTFQRSKKDYQSAIAALRSAVKQKPDLRVLVCTSGGPNVLVYVEKDWSFMQTLAETGMKFTPAAGNYFKPVSWEDVPGLDADLILFMGQASPTNPAWKAMPAVKAGHVDSAGTDAVNWQIDTYATYTTQIKKLTAAVRAA